MKQYPDMFEVKSASDYSMSPAGLLVLAAHTFYRLKHEKTPAHVENAKTTMQEILAAARRAGYARIAQLSAALVRGDVTPRLTMMANEACAKVPEDTMHDIALRATFC
jgi:hypothetical protein